jgi:predicted CoA-substrate-specific enzyme activase
VRSFCGIDIGSCTVKVVLVDEEGEMIGCRISPSGSQFYRNAHDALSLLRKEHGIGINEISHTTSTGYGRRLFKEANDCISEITANAIGARKTGESCGVSVKSIVNIGGQDSKVILLDCNGGVKDFGMNDKCAAGTGSFLEMTARSMNVDLNDLGKWHLDSSKAPATINSTCSVFAASEIISLLAGGYEKGEIIAGVHGSIARRISHLAERVGIDDRVLFDGGGAMNTGLKSALEEELMRELFVSETPQITTALGAALHAREVDSRSLQG